MQKLIDLVYQFREYGVLVFYCVLSLWLYAVQNTQPVKLMRATALEVLSTLETSVSVVHEYLTLKDENLRLRQQNLMLSSETNLLRNAALKHQEIKSMLAFQDSHPSELKLARIVHRTFGSERTLLSINLGERDSIRTDMPVLTDRGLVGRVVLTSPNYALVQPVINTDFKVSVYCEKTRAMGVVHWNGQGEDHAKLEHIPISSQLEWGDRLYTTAFSTFTSPDILVGTITSFKKNEFFYDVNVDLAIDFSTLQYVFVEIKPKNLEKEKMIEAYESFQ
jgi:rod shape-determining protein MreC